MPHFYFVCSNTVLPTSSTLIAAKTPAQSAAATPAAVPYLASHFQAEALQRLVCGYGNHLVVSAFNSDHHLRGRRGAIVLGLQALGPPAPTGVRTAWRGLTANSSSNLCIHLPPT